MFLRCLGEIPCSAQLTCHGMSVVEGNIFMAFPTCLISALLTAHQEVQEHIVTSSRLDIQLTWRYALLVSCLALLHHERAVCWGSRGQQYSP